VPPPDGTATARPDDTPTAAGSPPSDHTLTPEAATPTEGLPTETPTPETIGVSVAFRAAGTFQTAAAPVGLAAGNFNSNTDEYLDLLGKNNIVSHEENEPGVPQTNDIHVLNREFLRYLNFGGYPEVIFSEKIQADPARFVKSDIIDKVLLRDLPGLYGIQDIQELNYLFTTLAFNTANEISLEQLSQKSGVAKNTIKRYIEYLEAAFLLKVVHRIDRSARRFQRANFFKVYLTNPSMRSALFSPMGEDDEAMGSLAETGIFSQWFHSAQRAAAPLYYARWSQGEVDIVSLGPEQKPLWAVEVKWTDRFAERPWELKSLIRFCRSNDLRDMTVTTKTVSVEHIVDGIRIRFVPASIYCYTVGYNIVRGKDISEQRPGGPAIPS